MFNIQFQCAHKLFLGVCTSACAHPHARILQAGQTNTSWSYGTRRSMVLRHRYIIYGYGKPEKRGVAAKNVRHFVQKAYQCLVCPPFFREEKGCIYLSIYHATKIHQHYDIISSSVHTLIWVVMYTGLALPAFLQGKGCLVPQQSKIHQSINQSSVV